ncbi:hypothetical protein Esti_004214 [Eimeria stiedai]
MEGPATQSSINRKIAQLTKVIYRLNSLQEDHELHLQALSEAHEQEVEDVLADANAKLAACAREAREARLSRVTEAEVEDLKQQLLQARRRADEEVALQQAAFEAVGRRRQEEWQAELTRLKEEWATWQASLGSASLALDKARQELEASHEALRQRLGEKETRVQQLRAQLCAVDAVSLAEALRSQAKQLQQQLQDALEEAAAARAAAAAAAAAASVSEAQQQTIGQQLEALSSEVQRLQQQRRQEEQRYNQAVSELQQQPKPHRKPSRTVLFQHTSRRDEGLGKKCIISFQRASCQFENTSFASWALVGRFSRVCAAHETKQQETEEFLLSERELLTSAASGFAKLLAALEKEGLRREEQLQQSLSRCKSMQDAPSFWSFLFSPCKPLPALGSLFPSRGTAASSVSLHAFTFSMKQQEAQWSTKECSLPLPPHKHQYFWGCDLTPAALFSLELVLQETAKQKETAEAAAELQKQLDAKDQQMQEAQTAIAELRQQGDRQQHEIARLQASLQLSSENLQEAEEERHKLQKNKEHAEAETKEAQNQLLQHLQTECLSLSAKVKALETELGSNRLRQEREAQEAWGVEHGLRLQLRAAQAEAAEVNGRLVDTLRLLSTAKEQEQLLAQLVAELRTRLAEERAQSQEAAAEHQAEVEQQRERLEAEKEKALAAAAAAAADLESLKRQHAKAFKAAEAQAEKQRRELKAQLLADHSAQLQALLCSHRSQQEEKEKEHQQEKDALAKSLKEAAAASAAGAAARLNAAAEQVKALQQQLEGTKDELRLREAESSERLQALESLRLSHQQAVAAHQEAAERHKSELCKHEEEARQREQALELLVKFNEQGLLRTHEATLAELHAEHKADIELHQTRIDALESRLAAQTKQFEKRPSREEDLDTIVKLTKALEETKATLLQREEVIRRLKFEFLSQDRAYTKVFGSNPTIGVIDPLESSSNAGFSRAARRSSTRSFAASQKDGGGLSVAP